MTLLLRRAHTPIAAIPAHTGERKSSADTFAMTNKGDRWGVPVSDLDIRRLARLFIQLDGEHATAKAREMVAEMRRKGDNDGADTWLRIIVAIGEPGGPPTDAMH
jgi:hypothetical protein